MASSAPNSSMASIAPGAAADALVVFGISGDLAKKMTFKSLYLLERRGLLDCPIAGVRLDAPSTDDRRPRARGAVAGTPGGEVAFDGGFDQAAFGRLAARVTSGHGDFDDDATYRQVKSALGAARTVVYYLEIPPSLF